jgi:hypothetical protein
MSLGHSSRDQEASGGTPVLETPDDEQDAAHESFSNLAEEAVPMRDRAMRELEDMHEERIRAVVGGRGRRLTRPTVNARILFVGGAAVVILALVAALSSSGGRSASTDAATQTQRPPAPQSSIQSESRSRQPQRLVRAHARRRAAIRAKRKAARRHAQRERMHRQAPNVEAVPSQSEASVPESPPPASASPPPVAATTESAPPPASSPPPSTSTDPAEEQFGFER